jgi:hypothetical protein
MIKMKRSARKTFVLAVGVLAVAVLTAGCQEEQSRTSTMSNDQMSSPSDAERMSKLVAAENLDLKKKLAEQEQRHTREMQQQRAPLDKEIRNKQRLLDSCLQQKKSLEELSRDGVESYMSNIVGPLVDESQKLRKENDALKVQVQNLQGQIDMLRAETGTPK